MADHPPVINREDVAPHEVQEGDIRFTRRRLAAAAGARRIGCSHFQVPPGVATGEVVPVLSVEMSELELSPPGAAISIVAPKLL